MKVSRPRPVWASDRMIEDTDSSNELEVLTAIVNEHMT